jgi:regulator of PEP synthase PpsR (kinase-PPPase family)
MKTRLLSRQTLGVTSEYNYEDANDEQRLTEEAEQIAAQKSLQRELEFEQEMLLEREQRIKQIESNILDVNEIMRDLGAMVHDQGGSISKWSRSH